MSHKIKTPHPLWDYFSKVANMVICNQCSKKLPHRTALTNLKSHLQRKHCVHYKIYIRKLKHHTFLQKSVNPRVSTNETVYLLPKSKDNVTSPGIQEMEDSEMRDTGNNETISTELQKEIDASLIKFLVQSYQPASMIEGQGFARLMTALNADYKMPTRKAFTKKILPEMYTSCFEDQIEIIEREAETICLSIDHWISVKDDEPVIAITAHFISPDYKFKSVLLKCGYCEPDSKNVQSFISDTCFHSVWATASKINWCVTDLDADIVQAVTSLGWNHRSCMAYKLNLAIQNSLHLCDNILSIVKDIVHYFNSDYEAVQILDANQIKIGILEPMELLDSELTSWTTEYDMIERFITLQEAIEATMAQTEITFIITNEDWIKAKQLTKLLKPFREATQELSADKYVSASKEIAIVNGLKDVIQELHKRPDCYSSVKEVVESIEKELKERFDGIENDPNLALCTILDPRYKMSMFLDESAADTAKLNLISDVELLLKHNKDLINHSKLEDSQTSSDNDDDEEEEQLSLWRRRTMILEKRRADLIENKRMVAEEEVESYIQEELTDTDPCIWWQSHESKFPNLAKLFRMKCNKVATSVPSDELFTEQGIELRERKKMLSLNKAERIVFLHANLNDDDYLRLMPTIDDNLRMLSV